MRTNLKITDRFYFLAVFIIIAVVLTLIFDSLPDKESIAALEKKRVLGASDQKIVMPLPIIIKDNEEEWRGTSNLTDIKKIIQEFEVPLYPEDIVSSFPDPKLKIGATITINRAPVIFLNNGLISLELRSWSKTVSELLIEKNIVLGPLDKISLPLESSIKNKDTISITRIGERDETIEEMIAYQKIEKPTSEMYKGEYRLEQKGSNGRRIKTFRLRYENNALVSRNLIKDEIVLVSQSEITLIGTKPKITVRCRYNDLVEEASAKYGVDPNSLCRTMICESNGNPYSGYPNGPYQGLFQYDPSFWITISARAGFAGASITDPKAQIFVTSWAWSHGYRGRWPNC